MPVKQSRYSCILRCPYHISAHLGQVMPFLEIQFCSNFHLVALTIFRLPLSNSSRLAYVLFFFHLDSISILRNSFPSFIFSTSKELYRVASFLPHTPFCCRRVGSRRYSIFLPLLYDSLDCLVAGLEWPIIRPSFDKYHDTRYWYHGCFLPKITWSWPSNSIQRVYVSFLSHLKKLQICS